MKKIIVLLSIISIIFIVYVGIDFTLDIYHQRQVGEDIVQEETTTAKTEEKTKTEEKKKTLEDTTITLVAVGDNLMHENVISTGKQQDGTYNYDCLFENITEDLKKANLAVINQETIFGSDQKEFSAYPKFNSPTAVGDSEVKAGFNVILHATNHTTDMGTEGVENCLEFWKTKHPKTTVLGINDSKKAQNTIPVVEKNGIKVAMLNYTYGTNGNTVLGSEKSYLVNYLDENRVVSDIKKAKKKADFVIVFPHWGTEDVSEVTQEQVKYAKLMSNAGADLIIGTHPHVLQKVEWIKRKDGNRTLCYYSLGNYISGQNQLSEILGGMARVKIERKDGVTRITGGKLVPLATYYNWSTNITRTYKLSKCPKDFVSTHSIKRYVGNFTTKQLRKKAIELVGKRWIATR